MRAVVLVLVVTSVIVHARDARAQGTWVVAVVHTGDEASPAARRVADIAAVRLRGYGASVVDVARARAAIEQRLGRAPNALPEDFARRLATASDEVLEHVAFGRTEQALAEVDPLLERADEHLAAIGANDTARAHLANLCLFSIRALLHEERGAEAEMRAVDCLRFQPGLEPDERLHPRNVRALLSEVRDATRETPRGTLAVAGRAGCAVVVNGVALGETPFERAVPPGSYDVQVVCGGDASARVRRVDVPRDGRTDVELASALIADVDARDGVALAYAGETTRAASLTGDAARLARILDVSNVLAVSRVPDALRLERIAPTESGGTVLASVELSADPTLPAEQVDRAVTALLESRGVADDDASAAGDGPSPVGYVLGGVGLAGLVTTWILQLTWFDLQRQVDALDPDMHPTQFPDAVSSRDDRGTVVLIAGAASAAILTAAVPLLLPDEDGVPWWSWIAGAAGIGALAFGILHALADKDTLDDRNVAERTVPLGPLIAMHAAPLLAIPITHLLAD